MNMKNRTKNKKILFICGSLNQTTMLYKISRNLTEYDLFFTPYYSDGLINILVKIGFLNKTILGGRHRKDTVKFLQSKNVQIDDRGKRHAYDLVLTGSDAIIQNNIRNKPMVLVQEGMTEPEGWLYHLVRLFHLPRWIANTSVTGLSNTYDIFCVASHGYRDMFIKKGVQPGKIVVTGIPNFDDLANVDHSAFPHENFVLAATTPFRETFRPENRKEFIQHCLEIANGRQLIFKLHPLENVVRAIEEIKEIAPHALVFWRGNVNEMIARADTVITQQSTCTYTAIALGKKIYSDLNTSSLKSLMPIQNGGTSAVRIAKVCQHLIHTPIGSILQRRKQVPQKPFSTSSDI